MTTIDTARTRAEEMLRNLQKRARELLEAEDGLVKTVRSLVEENGLTPNEVQKRLEELMGRIKANKVWDRVKTSDALATLQDYRGEFERRVEGSMHRFLSSLSLASKNDVQDLTKQVNALNRKVNDLSKKISAQD